MCLLPAFLAPLLCHDVLLREWLAEFDGGWENRPVKRCDPDFRAFQAARAVQCDLAAPENVKWARHKNIAY